MLGLEKKNKNINVKGKPGMRPASTCVHHRICTSVQAAAAESINTAHTAALGGSATLLYI